MSKDDIESCPTEENLSNIQKTPQCMPLKFERTFGQYEGNQLIVGDSLSMGGVYWEATYLTLSRPRLLKLTLECS